MSRIHDNVTWQDATGKWAVGFFLELPSWGNDEDERSEFDHDKFEFASTGHATPISAMAAWDGANPGGTWEIYYHKDNLEEIERYSLMARAYKDPKFAAEWEEKKRKEKNRKHRAELKKRLLASQGGAPDKYSTFTIGLGDSPDFSHVFTEVRLKLVGDWLGFDEPKKLKNSTKYSFTKVWNTKTQALGPRVVDIRKQTFSLGYRY